MSRPAGSSRPAVRGLRASISASISRFSAIASDRAPTIATVIQTRSCALGTASTARNAPTYANGSAKTVCSILTSEAKRRGSGPALTASRSGVGKAAPALLGSGEPTLRSAGDPTASRRRAACSAWSSAGWSTAKPSRHAAGRAGQVDDERRPADTGDPAREQAVRRLRDRVGADRLGDPRRRTIEHLHRRLRGDVARTEARSARGEHDLGVVRQGNDRVGDRVALVRHDPPLDLEPLDGRSSSRRSPLVSSRVPSETPSETVSTAALTPCSFVFSTSRTPSTTISLSIAFAMS